MFFRFSALLSSIAFCSSLLKEMKLMVFVFSIFIRLLSFSFLVELETAVGDTLSILAISLWLSFSPAFRQSKEKISCSSIVHLSLYISILLYVCKVKFIYLSIFSYKKQHTGTIERLFLFSCAHTNKLFLEVAAEQEQIQHNTQQSGYNPLNHFKKRTGRKVRGR